jgi:uncharacterized protein (TIGR04255 family)
MPTVPLEKLSNPPIVEVVCGIIFNPLKIDPLVLAPYRAAKAGAFPKHQLQPAIEEPTAGAPPPFVLRAGVPPLRTWLFSADDAFVLQIQHDRFYLNWRRIADREYPRFSDRGSSKPGLLSRVLEEFREFSEFCEAIGAGRPVPTRIELAKVDHLVEGRHWKGVQELAAMLPWLSPLLGMARSEAPGLNVQFMEPRESGVLAISFESAYLEATRLAKLESRVTKATAPDRVRQSFIDADLELNEVFERLIPKPQRDAKFQ